MALGSAGCGYEYRNINGLCGHLTTNDDDDFVCIKHNTVLQSKSILEWDDVQSESTKHSYAQHPFRCQACKR